ncbi:serine/threonine-protein kinase TOR [Kipferlia bialata]|uniref:non-specific serine/threonine protein kinase n=1 Tax=Kipferlia bialata TaxID=797122 RepID=A0A9K3GE79_9EUKA|nr:serine/threonine-protein kinase TOR [Kipferlia bialata]|eukprot:g254.t1
MEVSTSKPHQSALDLYVHQLENAKDSPVSRRHAAQSFRIWVEETGALTLSDFHRTRFLERICERLRNLVISPLYSVEFAGLAAIAELVSHRVGDTPSLSAILWEALVSVKKCPKNVSKATHASMRSKAQYMAATSIGKIVTYERSMNPAVTQLHLVGSIFPLLRDKSRNANIGACRVLAAITAAGDGRTALDDIDLDTASELLRLVIGHVQGDPLVTEVARGAYTSIMRCIRHKQVLPSGSALSLSQRSAASLEGDDAADRATKLSRRSSISLDATGSDAFSQALGARIFSGHLHQVVYEAMGPGIMSSNSNASSLSACLVLATEYLKETQLPGVIKNRRGIVTAILALLPSRAARNAKVRSALSMAVPGLVSSLKAIEAEDRRWDSERQKEAQAQANKDSGREGERVRARRARARPPLPHLPYQAPSSTLSHSLSHSMQAGEAERDDTSRVGGGTGQQERERESELDGEYDLQPAPVPKPLGDVDTLIGPIVTFLLQCYDTCAAESVECSKQVFTGLAAVTGALKEGIVKYMPQIRPRLKLALSSNTDIESALTLVRSLAKHAPEAVAPAVATMLDVMLSREPTKELVTALQLLHSSLPVLAYPIQRRLLNVVSLTLAGVPFCLSNTAALPPLSERERVMAQHSDEAEEEKERLRRRVESQYTRSASAKPRRVTTSVSSSQLSSLPDSPVSALSQASPTESPLSAAGREMSMDIAMERERDSEREEDLTRSTTARGVPRKQGTKIRLVLPEEAFQPQDAELPKNLSPASLRDWQRSCLALLCHFDFGTFPLTDFAAHVVAGYLDDPDASLRRLACAALGHILIPDTELNSRRTRVLAHSLFLAGHRCTMLTGTAIRLVVVAVTDEEPSVRLAAYQAIHPFLDQFLHHDTDTVALTLTLGVNDTDPEVRKECLSLMGRLSPNRPALLYCLRNQFSSLLKRVTDAAQEQEGPSVDVPSDYSSGASSSSSSHWDQMPPPAPTGYLSGTAISAPLSLSLPHGSERESIGPMSPTSPSEAGYALGQSVSRGGGMAGLSGRGGGSRGKPFHTIGSVSVDILTHVISHSPPSVIMPQIDSLVTSLLTVISGVSQAKPAALTLSLSISLSADNVRERADQRLHLLSSLLRCLGHAAAVARMKMLPHLDKCFRTLIDIISVRPDGTAKSDQRKQALLALSSLVEHTGCSSVPLTVYPELLDHLSTIFHTERDVAVRLAASKALGTLGALDHRRLNALGQVRLTPSDVFVEGKPRFYVTADPFIHRDVGTPLPPPMRHHGPLEVDASRAHLLKDGNNGGEGGGGNQDTNAADGDGGDGDHGSTDLIVQVPHYVSQFGLDSLLMLLEDSAQYVRHPIVTSALCAVLRSGDQKELVQSRLPRILAGILATTDRAHRREGGQDTCRYFVEQAVLMVSFTGSYAFLSTGFTSALFRKYWGIAPLRLQLLALLETLLQARRQEFLGYLPFFVRPVLGVLYSQDAAQGADANSRKREREREREKEKEKAKDKSKDSKGPMSEEKEREKEREKEASLERGAQSGTGEAFLYRTLLTIQAMTPLLRDYLHNVVPALLHLLETPTVNRTSGSVGPIVSVPTQVRTLDTLERLCRTLPLDLHLSSLIQVLLLVISRPDVSGTSLIARTAVRVLCCAAFQAGSQFVVFVPAVSRVLSRKNVTSAATRDMETICNSLLGGVWPPRIPLMDKYNNIVPISGPVGFASLKGQRERAERGERGRDGEYDERERDRARHSMGAGMLGHAPPALGIGIGVGKGSPARDGALTRSVQTSLQTSMMDPLQKLCAQLRVPPAGEPDQIGWITSIAETAITHSPCGVLRACSVVTKRDARLARSLLTVAFLSLYDDADIGDKKSLAGALARAVSSDLLGMECLQMLLDLIEYMERTPTNFCDVFDFRGLSFLSEKCSAFAKALHYREKEYELQPLTSVRSLININHQLGLTDAAAGVIMHMQVRQRLEELRGQASKEHFHVRTEYLERLQDWGSALDQYQRRCGRFSISQAEREDALFGELRCLFSLGEYRQAQCIVNTVISAPKGLDPSLTETAPKGSRLHRTPSHTHVAMSLSDEQTRHMQKTRALAAFRMGDMTTLALYVTDLPTDEYLGAFLRAVLAVHRRDRAKAIIYIERAQRLLDPKFVALMAESYPRAYRIAVQAAQLEQLSQIIRYMETFTAAELDIDIGSPTPSPHSLSTTSATMDRHCRLAVAAAGAPHVSMAVGTSGIDDGARVRGRYIHSWNQLLAGVDPSPDTWAELLAIRRLVIPSTCDVDVIIRYAHVCRAAGRNALSERTLLSLVSLDKELPVIGKAPSDGMLYLTRPGSGRGVRASAATMGSEMSSLTGTSAPAIYAYTRHVWSTDASPASRVRAFHLLHRYIHKKGILEDNKKLGAKMLLRLSVWYAWLMWTDPDSRLILPGPATDVGNEQPPVPTVETVTENGTLFPKLPLKCVVPASRIPTLVEDRDMDKELLAEDVAYLCNDIVETQREAEAAKGRVVAEAVPPSPALTLSIFDKGVDRDRARGIERGLPLREREQAREREREAERERKRSQRYESVFSVDSRYSTRMREQERERAAATTPLTQPEGMGAAGVGDATLGGRVSRPSLTINVSDTLSMSEDAEDTERPPTLSPSEEEGVHVVGDTASLTPVDSAHVDTVVGVGTVGAETQGDKGHMNMRLAERARLGITRSERETERELIHKRVRGWAERAATLDPSNPRVHHAVGYSSLILATSLQEKRRQSEREREARVQALPEEEREAERTKEREGENEALMTEAIDYYSRAAAEGYFRCIAGPHSQDAFPALLRLLSILFKTSQGSSSVFAVFQEWFDRTSLDLWLSVVPQIIARMDSPSPSVRALVRHLLTTVGTRHPQALVYPLTVAAKTSTENGNALATSILNDMSVGMAKGAPSSLVGQAKLVSRELIRTARLWPEIWFKGIEVAAQFYYEDTQIDKMFASLGKLFQLLQTGAQTPAEQTFVSAFEGVLKEVEHLLKNYTLKKNPSRHLLEGAWEHLIWVYHIIEEQLPVLRILDLVYTAPALLECKDLELCVPGSYVAGQDVVGIHRFQPLMTVIHSKHRPRQATLIGSDGMKYVFCLKGSEDTRLDERVMQVFGYINTAFLTSPDTDRLGLMMHRYPVVPLSPSAGLISWVPDHDTLHNLIDTYRKDYSYCNVSTNHERTLLSVRRVSDYETASIVHKMEAFTNTMKQSTGLDIHKMLWLRSSSSEEWLLRRTAYTRSMAVGSIVGYLIGLGDRHPNNIMLGRSSGRVLHIDYGDCFETAMRRSRYPEKVPFRLTRIVVRAMSVSKVEGTFRTTCNLAMHVLRGHRDSIMAMLEAFVYDPLITWRLLAERKAVTHKMTKMSAHSGVRHQGRAGRNMKDLQHEDARGPDLLPLDRDTEAPEGDGEQDVNPKALAIVKRVEAKLTGKDFPYHPYALGIARQVELLIHQATNVENLVQAWKGWCPEW